MKVSKRITGFLFGASQALSQHGAQYSWLGGDQALFHQTACFSQTWVGFSHDPHLRLTVDMQSRLSSFLDSAFSAFQHISWYLVSTSLTGCMPFYNECPVMESRTFMVFFMLVWRILWKTQQALLVLPAHTGSQADLSLCQVLQVPNLTQLIQHSMEKSWLDSPFMPLRRSQHPSAEVGQLPLILRHFWPSFVRWVWWWKW